MYKRQTIACMEGWKRFSLAGSAQGAVLRRRDPVRTAEGVAEMGLVHEPAGGGDLGHGQALSLIHI